MSFNPHSGFSGFGTQRVPATTRPPFGFGASAFIQTTQSPTPQGIIAQTSNLNLSPSPESQKTRLTYQVNVPSSLGIKDSEYNYYSPIFSTNNNMFWQLSLVSDKEYYGIFISPVANLDEIIWGERSKLSFELFIKELRNNQMTDLFTGNVVVPHDTEICGHGNSKAIKKSSFQSEELIIGVRINNIEYKESRVRKKRIPKPIPKDLINVWKDHLFDFQPADVEFNVQGEKFYTCSSILSKRSKYFATILSGQWAESNNKESGLEVLSGSQDSQVIVDEKNNENNDKKSDSKSKYQIKHHIEISEYDSITFSTMLEYLYTDQVNWTNEDKDSISAKLFCLADKYLLTDLRERAKIRILDELNISNASEIVFGLVPKYEDLKEPVLKFTAKNFQQISASQEFKDILANLTNYPNYNVILTEILAEHFKLINPNSK